MLISWTVIFICSNFYMRGPSFGIAKSVGTIVLGQIVIDEVCNKYQEILNDGVLKLQRNTKNLIDCCRLR